MAKVSAIDLFAGAGGMSLGARMAGIRVALAVEADTYAARTYSANHPGTVTLCTDIRRLTKRRLSCVPRRGYCTVLFGGPPCQGFSYSNARTRKSTNPSNWLFKEFIRVARLWQPDWIVFENVKGIIDTAGGIFASQVIDSFQSLGYGIEHGLLNSSQFGVPQDRTRFFLVACRKGYRPSLPAPSRSPAPTVRDAISDLPFLSNGASISWMPYRRAACSSYAEFLRNGASESPNHLVTCNSAQVVRRYAYIPQGGNWENIPARLMRNYADRLRCHTGIYHRLSYRNPSVVIGNFRKNMLIHPTQNRGLSVREAARIQSFPDDYEFCGSIGFQQQQVGNAVPPLLAKAVFGEIVEAIA